MLPMLKGKRGVGLLLVMGLALNARADQPIMNMMPRWDGGYGIQVLAETIHRSDLKQGKEVLARGHREEIQQLHLQGVYTWDRAIRLTFKLPYVTEARREIPGAGSSKTIEHDKGWGDLTLARGKCVRCLGMGRLYRRVRGGHVCGDCAGVPSAGR